MRRQLLLLAAAAVLALAGLGIAALLRPTPAPGIDQLAAQIAAQLRCPDCQGLSVAESHTAAASAIRAQIRTLLDGGATAAEVRQHFVDRYGDWILLLPPSPWATWAPAMAVLAGIAVAAWLALARRPRRAAAFPVAPATDPAVRREWEELDA